jgi:hypothetical protein
MNKASLEAPQCLIKKLFKAKRNRHKMVGNAALNGNETPWERGKSALSCSSAGFGEKIISH